MDKLQSFFDSLAGSIITPERLWAALSFVLLLVVLAAALKIAGTAILRIASPRMGRQTGYLLAKALRYVGLIIILVTAFNKLGINLSALLGAAGIAGIAIGFAAQTSVSNIISGFFIMTERSFEIGDTLKFDAVTGVVESIDLLSIKLKTFDNQFIRIPNETVIKTQLVNVTHYPVRRFTLTVGVAYGTDLEKVRSILLELASNNEYAIADPAPVVIFDSFGASSINIVFGVWANTANFLDLKNSMMVDVSKRFASEGISIPFPQMDVHLVQG